MPNAKPPGKTIRRIASGLTAALAIALAAFLVRAANVDYPVKRLSFDPDPGTWRGVFHVHTRASDGLGTVADVAAAARASGAAWVLVADHNLMEEPRFRIVDGVLVVFSPEVGVPDGHVTALGASRALTRPERRAKDALETIRTLGGSPVAAHPLGRKRPYRRLDDPLLGGIEVFSADQEFRDALVSPLRLAPAALAYLVNPQDAIMRLLRRPDLTLARWDQLLAERPMPGFCAVDAHGRPPYLAMMASLQMHAVVGHPPTGNADADGAALIEALALGRSFCGVEAIAGAGGFRFTGVDDAGGVTVGGELHLDRRPVVQVDMAYGSLPAGARPVLLCGGTEADLTEATLQGARRYGHRPTRPGACRAEIRLDNGAGGAWPWILSNPIYVR